MAGGARAGLLAGLGWLLAACAGPAEAPPEPVADRTPEPARKPAPASPVEPATQASLCEVLTHALAAGPDGFRDLRGRQIAGERWQASMIVPRIERCTIEGEAWPRARFRCRGERLGPEQAHARFDQLAAGIDRCLARPSWFPRTWDRGHLFQFAMGERQLAWIDRSTGPPTAVVLKVQQDLTHWDYRVLLDLHAAR